MEEQRRLTDAEHVALWDEEMTQWLRSRRSSWSGFTILTLMCLLTMALGLGIFLLGISLLS